MERPNLRAEVKSGRYEVFKQQDATPAELRAAWEHLDSTFKTPPSIQAFVNLGCLEQFRLTTQAGNVFCKKHELQQVAEVAEAGGAVVMKKLASTGRGLAFCYYNAVGQHDLIVQVLKEADFPDRFRVPAVRAYGMPWPEEKPLPSTSFIEESGLYVSAFGGLNESERSFISHWKLQEWLAGIHPAMSILRVKNKTYWWVEIQKARAWDAHLKAVVRRVIELQKTSQVV